MRGCHDVFAMLQQARHQFDVFKNQVRLELFTSEESLSEDFIPGISMLVSLCLKPIALPVGKQSVGQLQSRMMFPAYAFINRIFKNVYVFMLFQPVHQPFISMWFEIIVTVYKGHIISFGNLKCSVSRLTQPFVGLVNNSYCGMFFCILGADLQAVVCRSVINQDDFHALNLLSYD